MNDDLFSRAVAPAVSKSPKLDDELLQRAKGWEARLGDFADQMHREGRGMFARDLRECQRAMRELRLANKGA